MTSETGSISQGGSPGGVLLLHLKQSDLRNYFKGKYYSSPLPGMAIQPVQKEQYRCVLMEHTKLLMSQDIPEPIRDGARLPRAEGAGHGG
jgi:hypothetical protein